MGRVLEYLLTKKLCPIEVVTKSGNLLDEFSAGKRLVRHRWPLANDGEDQDRRHNIGLVASFGHLIDEKTINRFEYGLFNVHPSLLPSYRGSTPIQAAIRDGCHETGCTIMQIPPVAKFDIGNIILQERLPIKDRDYAIELRDRLAHLGSTMAERLLLDYELSMGNARPQSDQGRSYAKKLKPEDGMLCFKSESTLTIDRKVRAYTGFIDLYTYCLGRAKVRLDTMRDPSEVDHYDLDRLASGLLPARCTTEEIGVNIPAGTMFFHKLRHTLCIKCADNRWLAFDHATPEHKATMSSLEFYNGYLSKLDPRYMKTSV